MSQIQARIYFDKITGEVLTITSEIQGCVEETTREQDMKIYTQLKDKNINEVDFIELEYGTLSDTFSNSKSYSVNLDTKKLEVIYYTQEELNIIQQQNQEVQDLNSRVSDITQYLSSSNETTIVEVENSILEIEKNKIINGGM